MFQMLMNQSYSICELSSLIVFSSGKDMAWGEDYGDQLLGNIGIYMIFSIH